MSEVLSMKRVLSFVPVSAITLTAAAAALGIIPNLKHFADPSGDVATFNTAGDIRQTNAFFQPLGTNGRACVTCHQADQSFSISAQGVRDVFDRTHGQDPLFAAVDGANCPTSTSTDAAAHSLLLERGLIRVGITLPANPQFQLLVLHDPYGCAVTADPVLGRPLVSVYRRPLPAANLRFLSTIMFDGRETVMPLNNAQTFDDNLRVNLTHQAISAVTGHAQGQPPTDAQLAEIVAFEMKLSTAQIRDNQAGALHTRGAMGGPLHLSSQSYHPGINDVLGADPSGAAFNPIAFTLFSAWEKPAPGTSDDRDNWDDKQNNAAREDIAAGQTLFNTRAAIITGVRGLNDNPALGSPVSITGTCTTCHDTPNVGNHSVALPLDIAISRQAAYESSPAISTALQQLTPPDLPVYEIRGCPDPAHPGYTLNYYTSDPGKALLTGLCADVNRGKGPVLRGLAARAPYFHNGAAANLQELVSFYNLRFQMNFTAREQKQLIAFLNSL